MTVSPVLRTAIVVFAVSGSEILRAGELPCEAQKLCPEDFNIHAWCMTSEFWFEATSASGASGDVVAVTFSLHFVPEFAFEFDGIDLTVCHDPSLTEIVGEPVYSEDVLARNPLAVHYLPVQEGSKPSHKGYGFYAHIGAMADRSPVVGELPLLTMYYRLTGFAGESTEISFCDGQFLVFGPASCNFSSISDSRINFIVPLVLSTQNQNTTLTILPGPATHPDRPPEPPQAVVYPKLPTSDEVNLQMRIANAVALPGERNVPVDVFVTADVEYTGVVLPIDFDERYVRVARVEDYFLSGTAVIDNDDVVIGSQPDEGYVVIVSSLGGKRRVAPAAETFHAATIYLDILDAAAETPRTALEPRQVGGRAGDPFIIVRHLEGEAAQQVEARGEIGPGEVQNGVVEIRSSLETIAGDVNFDGKFDISDPISVLGHLFLGRSAPLCPPAADYDRDGRVDISDSIRMLNVLFSGQVPPAGGESGLVGCR